MMTNSQQTKIGLFLILLFGIFTLPAIFVLTEHAAGLICLGGILGVTGIPFMMPEKK